MTNIYNMTDTWDDVGVDWAAIKMNVGDVASSAASKIIDLQVDSASQFNVDKDGNATIAGGISAASASFSTPIPLSSGGTNSTSATDARTALAVVGTVELAASGGSNLVGFLQSGTDAVARTVQSKLRDVVNIKDFGAIGDGVTDDTIAIQAAINSGMTAVFIPSGTYLASSLLMPNVFGFTFYGTGTGSVVKQKPGGVGALLRWDTSANVYNEQTIYSLSFDGSGGSHHIIDTTGQAGLTVRDCYFGNLPVGKSGIYSNGAASVYNHDNRFLNIQMYSSAAGHSGIRLGPNNADCEIVDFIMNGNFTTDYCLYLDSGAVSTQMSGGHPYNAKINVACLAGGNGTFRANSVCFDNALQDIVRISAIDGAAFSGCRFQAAQTGYSAVKITGTSTAIILMGSVFSGAASSTSAVSGDGTTTYVFVSGGYIESGSGFSAPFSFSGSNCYARGIGGHSPAGLEWGHSGVTTTTQAQNTTQYLGVGHNSNEANVEYVVPYNSVLQQVYIATSSTPAAGQTFTFRARKNGVDIGSSLVVNNGAFGGTITLGTSFQQYDRLTISSVFSAASGSADVRWSAGFLA